MMKKLQTVLNAGATVGNLGKVILAQSLLIFKAKGAVVGRDNL